jgi:hypothetical protein
MCFPLPKHAGDLPGSAAREPMDATDVRMALPTGGWRAMARVPRCQRYGLRFFWGVPEPMGSRTFEHLVSTWLSFLGLIAGNMSGQYSLIARREGWQPPHRPLWIRIVFFTTNKGNKSVQSAKLQEEVCATAILMTFHHDMIEMIM